MSNGPLIVQSDKSLLLEVDHEQATAARRAIAPFAELERAPEHIHTYRLTPLGLWNARAAGLDAETVVNVLINYSRYPVPHSILVDVAETMSRYGRLQLVSHPTHGLLLTSTDKAVLAEVLKSKRTKGLVGDKVDDSSVVVHRSERGNLKQALIKLGWPAEDLAGYVDGEKHPIEVSETDKAKGTAWEMREYQRHAVENFWDGGSGVVVLPCGAGKTIVGAGAMATQCPRANGATNLYAELHLRTMRLANTREPRKKFVPSPLPPIRYSPQNVRAPTLTSNYLMRATGVSLFTTRSTCFRPLFSG